MKNLLLLLLLGTTAVADVSIEFSERIMPLLHNYCYDCHDPDDEEHGAPFFEAKSVDDINKERHSWKSVAAQIRNRTMPPKRKKKQPTEDERIELATWIENFLQNSAKEMPEYAGMVRTRRLNRTQYSNTIRDLFGFDLGFASTFPKDGSGGEGFDNNGETLYLPPLLMERYMEASQRILDKAIITPALNLNFNPNEPVRFNTYLSSSYTVKLSYSTQEEQETQLLIDGLNNHTMTLVPDENKVQLDVSLDRGIHSFEFFRNVSTELKSLQVKQNLNQSQNQQFHDKLFVHSHDSSPESQRKAAKKNLELFMKKAFRRPVNESEISKYMALYDRAASRKDPYEECFKLVLNAVLLSPHFLFMIEEHPASEKIEDISSYELASRLSYFLWSSMPDDELFSLAENNSLKNEAVLIIQINRMLLDPKAYSFFENFTSQWLGTDEVGGQHSPSGSLEKEYKYSPELGMALREEPIQFFKHIVQKNRPLLDLIDSKYVLVNQLIAKHYGMKRIKGNHFRKVKTSNDQRGGILGFGGVQMATSFPFRTSPVLRGAWVIETILGTPVPSPPADIPALALKKKQNKNLTVRKVFEKHRENASCAACHDLIDPIGFGLGNYDLAGRWRTHENGNPVNASGVMPTGETFNGPKELKNMLMNKRDQFVRHLTAKLLGYALGRSLMHEDAGTIERAVEKIKQENYTAQALIKTIVMSTPFRQRQLISQEH